MGRPRNPANITRDAEIWSRWNNGERSLVTLAKDYGITAQRVGQVIAAKDREVYAAWRTGRHTLADLADAYGLTSEDVTRIVTARHPEQDEETGRAVIRSRIELLTLVVQDVIENPGWKLAPNGRLAEDADGNPLVDVNARIEAIKVQGNLLKNLAVLNGEEKPQRTLVRHDIARQEADAHLAAVAAKMEEERREQAAKDRELEAYRRQFGQVIPGEVLAELPPGSA